MSIQNITSQHSTYYSLDEILQDTPETTTEELLDIEETYQSYKEALNQELITTDRFELEIHAGNCIKLDHIGKKLLYRIVKSSVDHPKNSIAATNAITILKVMKVSFSCLDLRGVQIPGADLSSAILDNADLSGAILQNINLANASLNGTNMSKANLKKVKFGISDIFFHKAEVISSKVSPDNKYQVTEDLWYIYFWHLSSKKLIKKIPRPHIFSFNSRFPVPKLFTPDGQFLFTYDFNTCIDMWVVGSFEHIIKLKILYEGYPLPFFSFSPDDAYLIAYYEDGNNQTHLKVWEIQKTENKLLDINLKSEVISPFIINNICFSKKFPFFYCVKQTKDKQRIDLMICNIKELPKKLNKNELNKFFVDTNISLQVDKSFSLAVSGTSSNNEEFLFFVINNSIHTVKVLTENKQNWPPKLFPPKEIITAINEIYNFHLIEKSQELIYVCKDAIFLYSIKNNQSIFTCRLVDMELKRHGVFFDDANIYIGQFNKLFTHSLETLKSNKDISYQMASKAVCFSPDMSSIKSLSNSFYMTTYNIETGNSLESNLLQEMKSYVLYQDSKILFSHNTDHILICTPYRRVFTLTIIDIKNKKPYLKKIKYDYGFALSNTSEYLAYISPKHQTLCIYKTTPSLQCIGQFSIQNDCYLPIIALSTDFHNTRKVALMSNASTRVIVYDCDFKEESLELSSQKELSTKSVALQLMFTENNSKLIIACRERVILWDIKSNIHEEHIIQANCVDISQDGSLLIYYDKSWNNQKNTANHQLCLWSIVQKKLRIVQAIPQSIVKVQISPDNRYVIGTTENGGMYVWKILENSFRLLWRTSHGSQTQGLILGDNKLEKDVEEDLIVKMSTLKL